MKTPGHRIPLLAAAAALWPQGAFAHAFQTGSAYPQFIEGTAASIGSPVILLSLIPIGILASAWRENGMTVIWPALLVGLLAGIFLAVFATPAIAIAGLAVGTLAGGLGALALAYPPVLIVAFGGAGGVLSSMISLEGHQLGELPLAVYTGILFGALLCCVIPAGLVHLLLSKFPQTWMRIGVRILSSWSAAIATLLLAFQFR